MKTKLKYDNKNELVDYYIKNNISPVRQNIEDIEKHFNRRTFLYRSLGLLPSNVTGKKVLEIGPGSGYNSIVIASWKPSLYTLVEPNPVGVSHIKELFEKFNLSKDTIKIKNILIENFTSKQKFDVVICEGMIPSLENKVNILKKINECVKKDGLIIITCMDELSSFFDIIRAYFSYELTKNIESFDDKIKILIEAFKSHVETSIGFSRLIEDWCADNLLNDCLFNCDFSIEKCIEFFGHNYYLYNISPDFINDYRWYKEMPADPYLFNKIFLEQFEQRRHNFLHYKVVTQDRSINENKELFLLCQDIKNIISNKIKLDKVINREEFLGKLDRMINNLVNTDKKIINSVKDIKDIIQHQHYNVDIISSKYKSFRSAFGRTQQYISFIKA